MQCDIRFIVQSFLRVTTNDSEQPRRLELRKIRRRKESVVMDRIRQAHGTGWNEEPKRIVGDLLQL